MGVRFFSQVTSNRMAGKALKLGWGWGEGGVRMKSRKGFFTKKFVKLGTSCPVESPSVVVFKTSDVALGNI